MTPIHAMLSGRFAASSHKSPALWPTGTTFARGEVFVGGLALTTLARSETPAICVAPVTDPSGRTDPHLPSLRTIVVARVEDTVPALEGHHRQAWLDADLDLCSPVARATLLIGRVSDARTKRFTLRPSPAEGAGGVARLPDDLHRGDLVAVLCLGLVTTAEIRR